MINANQKWFAIKSVPKCVMSIPLVRTKSGNRQTEIYIFRWKWNSYNTRTHKFRSIRFDSVSVHLNCNFSMISMQLVWAWIYKFHMLHPNAIIYYMDLNAHTKKNSNCHIDLIAFELWNIKKTEKWMLTDRSQFSLFSRHICPHILSYFARYSRLEKGGKT